MRHEGLAAYRHVLIIQTPEAAILFPTLTRE
jgi:hypothetical protein